MKTDNGVRNYVTSNEERKIPKALVICHFLDQS